MRALGCANRSAAEPWRQLLSTQTVAALSDHLFYRVWRQGCSCACRFPRLRVHVVWFKARVGGGPSPRC